MCDYSLHHLMSRPANVGDKLIITDFFGSVTRGFAAIGERNVAVCLLPGTELAFEKEATYDHPFAKLMPRFKFGILGGNVARFRKINLHSPSMHHDALEFENGKIILLTRLSLGQRATVLQLPADARQATQNRREREPASQKGADNSYGNVGVLNG